MDGGRGYFEKWSNIGDESGTSGASSAGDDEYLVESKAGITDA